MKGANLNRLLTVIMVVLFLPAAPVRTEAETASNNKLSLTILHTNDLHSHEESFQDKSRTVGGLARIAHLIKLAKRTGKNVIAVDAGDVFQGTPFFEHYHGKTDIECLNKAGYDIFAIGNHEFDEGPDNLARQLKNARFDVLSANLDLSSHPALKAIVKPSVIKSFAGKKVAFVGVITPQLSALTTKLDNVKVIAPEPDWMSPVRQEVERLKREGIDKIVVVSHCGIELERQLAKAIADVDLVIGGHSHTRLDRPIIVRRSDGSTCLVVQTGCYGRALGRLDLSFDAAGRVCLRDTRYRLINISGRIWEDPEVKAYVEEMGRPFAHLKKTVAGIARADFDNRFARYPVDSPIGDLICDAEAESAREHGASIAVQNRGGIRAGIEEGPVTLAKIREVLPFDNTLVVATISGTTLLRCLENSVSGNLGAKFLDVHGLKVIYDRSRSPGRRIVTALANEGRGWLPIEPKSKYRIAVNSYSFSGGEGYSFPDACDVVETGRRTSLALQSYLEKERVVEPLPPSRIVEVSPGLLSLENGWVVVKAPPELAGSRVTIVVGEAAGVDYSKGTGTVPVEAARVVCRHLRLPAGNCLRLEPGKLLGNRDSAWAAAVVSAAKSNASRLVSYPVRLTRTSKAAAH